MATKLLCLGDREVFMTKNTISPAGVISAAVQTLDQDTDAKYSVTPRLEALGSILEGNPTQDICSVAEEGLGDLQAIIRQVNNHSTSYASRLFGKSPEKVGMAAEALSSLTDDSDIDVKIDVSSDDPNHPDNIGITRVWYAMLEHAKNRASGNYELADTDIHNNVYTNKFTA